MEKEYRVLSFSEGRELGISELYSCLVGPDEFECTLTEIEDRTWGRDLRPVVNRLKEQHARIAELEAQLAAAQERERWIPVTDIRPKRGQHVRVMATMEYDGEDHWIAEDGTVLEPGNILEWRELPAAPKEDK